MRLLIALAAALAASLVGATSTAACSCVGGDPRDRLSEAPAAFVGTVTQKTGGDVRPTYRMTVERVFKGDLAATIELTSDERSTCGVGLAVGQRVGVLLRRATPPYEVGLCDLIEPAELEVATRPYPRGSGAGTARLLVAGTFHDAGLAALDARGRLLGWVFGSSGDAVDVCPGAGYAVQAGDHAALIRLRDLAVVSRRKLPDEATAGVRCLSRSGERLAALTFDYGGRSDLRRLVVLRGARTRDLGVRDSPSAVMGAASAYLGIVSSRTHRLVAVDYRTGDTRRLVSRDGSVGSLALSPDERWLAFVASLRGRSGFRLGLAPTTRGIARVRTRKLDRVRSPLWLSSRRLAVPDERRAGDSFGLRLRRRGPVASWSTDLAVRAGRRVWWSESTVGLRARVLEDPRSPRMTVGYLSGARGLAAIRGGALVSAAPRRAPSNEPGASAASACGSRTSQ